MRHALITITLILLSGCGAQSSENGYAYLNNYPQDQHGVICYYDSRDPITSLTCVKVTP